MALTPKEQSKVVQILGYGGKSIQVGSVIYDKIMNDRLAHLTPDGEELVREYIGKILRIEKHMDAAVCRLSASEVNDIKLNSDELPQLRSERRKIAREVANFLDIPFQMVGGVNVSVRV
jgi:hypothetical protein